MNKFTVIKDYTSHIKKFNLSGRKLEFKIAAVPKDRDSSEWVKSAIKESILYATEDLEPTDMVGIHFCSTVFTRGDGWMAFRQADKVTVEHIWKILVSIFQSNSEGLSTDIFCLGVTTVRMPSGRGRGKNYNTFNEECAMRKGIVAITNKDNLCLVRSLVVAMSKITNESIYPKVRRDIGKIQTQRAQKLLEDAKITIPTEGAGIRELELLQQHLKGLYKIIVYKYNTKGREVIFEGSEEAPHRINLLYHDGHYNVIVSLTAAFCCIYFCEDCHVPSDHKDKHRCSAVCLSCRETPPCKQEQKLNCSECNRVFRSKTCFDNHKEPQRALSICEKLRRCNLCFKTVQRNREHICDEIFCNICMKHQPGDHMCYMQVDKRSPKTDDQLFIFYDLETQQDRTLDICVKEHIPNLCVFQQRCDTCIETDTCICKKCGVRQQVLHSGNVVAPFLHHLLTLRKI